MQLVEVPLSMHLSCCFGPMSGWNHCLFFLVKSLERSCGGHLTVACFMSLDTIKLFRIKVKI